MKKLTMIFTVLFAMLMTSFSQNVIKVGGGELIFYLDDGTNETTNITVAVNPNSFAYPADGGVMVITFGDFIDFTNITSTDLGIVGAPDEMKLDNGAVYGVKFTYDTYHTGNVYINYDPNTVFTFLTEQDTVDAYNNGVSSVDTESFYNSGFTAGVSSVPSVDTMSIWSNGYDSGIVEGENTASEDAYNAGYTDGTNSSTGVNDFAVTNLNVYPNPVNKTGQVTIDCDDFNNVKVLTITGQEIFSSTSNILNVSDFTTSTGYYVLVIEDMGFNVTNKKLLVQ